MAYAQTLVLCHLATLLPQCRTFSKAISLIEIYVNVTVIFEESWGSLLVISLSCLPWHIQISQEQVKSGRKDHEPIILNSNVDIIPVPAHRHAKDAGLMYWNFLFGKSWTGEDARTGRSPYCVAEVSGVPITSETTLSCSRCVDVTAPFCMSSFRISICFLMTTQNW